MSEQEKRDPGSGVSSGQNQSNQQFSDSEPHAASPSDGADLKRKVSSGFEDSDVDPVVETPPEAKKRKRNKLLLIGGASVVGSVGIGCFLARVIG